MYVTASEASPLPLSKPPIVSSTVMEGAENYYRWQFDVMASHLGQRIIEIGCGVGEFTRLLLGREKVVSVDIEPTAIEYARRRLAHAPNWEGIVGDAADEQLSTLLAPYRCDSVTALNVVEHIEDDRHALRILRRLLPVGGTVVVLVPAHQWLYGSFDAQVGHYRRYDRQELAAKMDEAGFTVDRILYFNMIGAVGWYVNYRILRRSSVSKGTVPQVQLFDRCLVPAARRLERAIVPRFGLSVIGLGTAR